MFQHSLAAAFVNSVAESDLNTTFGSPFNLWPPKCFNASKTVSSDLSLPGYTKLTPENLSNTTKAVFSPSFP